MDNLEVLQLKNKIKQLEWEVDLQNDELCRMNKIILEIRKIVSQPTIVFVHIPYSELML